MESSLPISSAIASPSTSPLSLFPPRRLLLSKRPLLFPVSSKNKKDEPDLHADAESTQLLVPFSSLSNDSAMGLVLSAAMGRGWTTGSGMEGPASPKSDPDVGAPTGLAVSTFPWSLFTRSPRRRMRVAFTCNVCRQRTTRAINPHAYTDGTVFVQCCGCNVFHKLVDNLNLFHEMKCYVNPSFQYKGDMSLDFFDGDMDNEDDDDDDDGTMFPII